jgi:hypothetical protein
MVSSTREEQIQALSLLEIVRGEDDLSFSVNISEEFAVWFKQDQKLKRWSDSKFQKWFKGFMSEAIREVATTTTDNSGMGSTVDPFDLPEDP